jgi:hypothetical protein
LLKQKCSQSANQGDTRTLTGLEDAAKENTRRPCTS